jgi:hypothetical protein
VTGELSWRRLKVLVQHLPANSTTARALGVDSWDLTDQLLAATVDLLALANWQRGGDKRAKRPTPIQRPGVKNPGEKRLGTASMPIDEMRRLLGQANRGGGDGC